VYLLFQSPSLCTHCPIVAAAFLKAHYREHERIHGSELMQLRSINSKESIQANEVARTFTKGKVDIQLTSYSQQLLMAFLEESHLMLLLNLINKRINLKVVSRRPLTQAEIKQSTASLNSESRAPVSFLNKKAVRWGTLSESYAIHQEARKQQIERMRKDNDTTMDDASASASVKQPPAKRTRFEDDVKDGGLAPLQGTVVLPAHTDESKVPLPSMSKEARMQLIQDLQRRVVVTEDNLPSVCFFTFLNATNNANHVAVSGDSQYVAAGFADSTIRVWDMHDPYIYAMKLRSRHLAQSEDTKNSDPNNSSTSAAATATAATTAGAAGTMDATIDVEDDVDMKIPYAKYVGHSGPVYKTSFSPDNKFLLSASEDSTIRLWSNETQMNLVCYKGHNYPVWDVEFSPVGFYFASASYDRTARLWSTARIQPLRIFAGHLSDVDCVTFHPNSNYIATGSTDRSVRLWDISSGNCVRLFTGHTAPVRSIAIAPNGRLLASSADDNTIILWDLADGRQLQVISDHERPVTCLSFSQDTTANASVLASGSLDSTVRLWDVSNATPSHMHDAAQVGPPASCLKTLYTKDTPLSFLSFTRRNLLLAAGVFQS
jgi:transcription initiation factor TFIID subunit 5